MIHTLEKIVSFIRNLQEEAWCSTTRSGRMHIPGSPAGRRDANFA